MRRIFISVMLMTVAAGLIIGLANGAKGFPTSKPTGELRIVFPSLWNETLDPILSSGSGRIGLVAIYDELVGAKPDGSALSKDKGLAKDWEMSADGKVWTLHLRKGIQFHRGYGELTAEDVKFSLERITSKRSVAQRKSYFKKKLGKIEVVDKYTVRIYSKGNPIPDFITYVSPLQSSTEPMIVSKRAVEELGEDGFATNPVGTGPYRFVEHMGGQYIKLEAVQNHWRIGVPRFKHVRFLAIPEEATSIAMLARGDADVLFIMRANINRVRQKNFDVILQKGYMELNIWLDDQFVESVPINKQKVREALNLAIDRQAIVDTIYEGHGRPMGTYYSQTPILNGIGYAWQEDMYPYDPKRARQLLAEAGYPNGFDMDVYIYPWIGVPETPEMMQAVAGMWSAIGVRPHLISVDYGVVRAKLLKGEIPGAAGYFPASPRPWQGMIGIYRVFMHSKGAFSHVQYDELDRLLNEASSSLNPEISKARLKEAIKFVREHHLAVPICEVDQAFAVSKKAIHWDPGFLPQNLNLDSLFGR